jgi:hypothetical protein
LGGETLDPLRATGKDGGAITDRKGCDMAGDGNTSGEAGAMDISAHRASYDSFMGWFKWGAVAAFILAAIVVVIIA